MVDITVSKSTIKKIDPKCVLTYRVIDEEHNSGFPALGWLAKVTEDDNFFYCEFELNNPELEKYIPNDADELAKFVPKDGDVLVSVIIAVPQADKAGILQAIGAVRVHTFSRCEKDFNKICSDSCGGCNEPVLFTDTKGRTFPVRGIELAEEIKAYALKNNMSYEKAYLTLTKGKENNHVI